MNNGFVLRIDFGLDWFDFGVFAVTAVESGRSALQYLGLDGETNSVRFSVSNFNLLAYDLYYAFNGGVGFRI